MAANNEVTEKQFIKQIYKTCINIKITTNIFLLIVSYPHQIVLMALWLSPPCMKACALIQTASQSRFGMLWITSIVMEATSAPFTDRDRSPAVDQTGLSFNVGFRRQKKKKLNKQHHRNTAVFLLTNNSIQSQRTLSQHFLIAGYSWALLTGLSVKIRQHHVDLEFNKVLFYVSFRCLEFTHLWTQWQCVKTHLWRSLAWRNPLQHWYGIFIQLQNSVTLCDFIFHFNLWRQVL